MLNQRDNRLAMPERRKIMSLWRCDAGQAPIAATVSQSELIRRWAAHVDVCDTCDGDGWLRANRSEGGKYIFGKETCYACNGEGKTEYVTALIAGL